ncbi:MAG: HlyC/CorC family transporter [Candidatus Riflebacteria bacterium]|nr:HlyC/CorC family transporter [Candidatus Riflebacteria bacterium]
MEIFVFIALLCMSAFFSATETAFFSLSPLRLKKVEDEGDPRASEILAIIADKQRLLISLLLGNTLVNVVSTALATRFILRFVESSDFFRNSIFGNSASIGVAIASVFMTIMILICGEITPKTVAIFNAFNFACIAVFPLKILLAITNPVNRVVRWILQKTFPDYSDWNRNLGSATTLDEIDSYFSLGEEVGIIERDEKKMISSVFEFGDTLVREVMVPRPDIVAIPQNIALESLLKLIRDDGHSRFPVYEGTLDRVTGALYVKDILVRYEELRNAGTFEIAKLLRPAYIVPETKKLDELLKEFQKRKLHMAVVVDEYGGISGLVTIEDLLEEIVGEIVDEYDQDEQAPIVQIEPGIYSVDARASIEDLEAELGATFDHEDSETVGGFVLEKLGRIPRRDEKVDDPAGLFVVSEIKGNRILRLRVTKKTTSNTTTPEREVN